VNKCIQLVLPALLVLCLSWPSMAQTSPQPKTDSPAPVGSHLITAEYFGDSPSAKTTSAVLTQGVNSAAATIGGSAPVK
jgi:hypothetical protein